MIVVQLCNCGCRWRMRVQYLPSSGLSFLEVCVSRNAVREHVCVEGGEH